MTYQTFYRAFEDQHRGTRELIKQRLSVYLAFVNPLAQLHPSLPVLDLGCGRGEWLELLWHHNIPAQGIDLDPGMLAACADRNLQASQGEALACLQAQASNSLLAVTGFHIAEHLPFDTLQALVAQAYRTLIPGGMLILETPNPENLLVGASHFYMDPTHQRPLPPQLLTFLASFCGFTRVKHLRLQEPASLQGATLVSLYDVLANVSPDYAVVAQKAPQTDNHPALDAAFAEDYGLSLHTLASRFDEQSAQRLTQLQHHCQTAVAQSQTAVAQSQLAAALATQLAGQAQSELADIQASHSWRLTAPLRWLGKFWRRASRQG